MTIAESVREAAAKVCDELARTAEQTRIGLPHATDRLRMDDYRAAAEQCATAIRNLSGGQDLKTTPEPNEQDVALERCREALRAYVLAQGRMRDKWAEGDENVKRDLWRNLHACGDAGRNALSALPAQGAVSAIEKTPRTDAAETAFMKTRAGEHPYQKLLAFARQLEREVGAATALYASAAERAQAEALSAPPAVEPQEALK